jgi:hypothetical protein
MSDGTHRLNFAGDKTEWPVYMTIANLSSNTRQMPSMHSVGMVALLPIPINNRNILQKRLAEQWQANRELLNEVLPEVSSHSSLHQIPAPRADITMFPVQMVISGVAYRF